MTIAEQYEEDNKNPGISGYTTIKNAIERIEARMDHYRADYDTIISEMARRITALEQPQDAKPQGREWIELQLTTLVWAHQNDGGVVKISFGTAIKRNNLYTHIMPYIPGDEKPLPPEGDK